MTETRPEPFFIADDRGLDFLNTIAVPVDVKVEWLASGEDLLAWLEVAGLIPDGVSKTFRRNALPGELDAVAAQARSLRDWFKLFVYRHMGRTIPPSALRELGPLNRLLARDEEFGQIVLGNPRGEGGGRHGPEQDGDSALVWCRQRRWQSPDSLLLPPARALADLVCNEDFTHLKACEGPECTLLFMDRTRGRGRRWCSMAVCGNRAKQAAHRKRARKARRRSR